MKLNILSDKTENTDNDIVCEIKQTQRDIENVYDRFQNLTDEDLLEACIYELQALKSKHSYLMKKAKEYGVKSGEEIFGSGRKAE